MTIAVIDLGVGNTASMMFALERLGARAVLTPNPAVVAEADKVILPGVGAAAYAMSRLDSLELTPVLEAFERPLLGVCLGQQLFYDHSEEGDADGLGLIGGEVKRLVAAPDRPVPHMGWNQLKREKDDPLLEGVEDGAWVYFVHSYACPPGPATLTSTDYGGRFSSIVCQGQVWGCQFHPELSSEVGSKILNNFLSLS